MKVIQEASYYSCEAHVDIINDSFKVHSIKYIYLINLSLSLSLPCNYQIVYLINKYTKFKARNIEKSLMIQSLRKHRAVTVYFGNALESGAIPPYFARPIDTILLPLAAVLKLNISVGREVSALRQIKSFKRRRKRSTQTKKRAQQERARLREDFT